MKYQIEKLMKMILAFIIGFTIGYAIAEYIIIPLI